MGKAQRAHYSTIPGGALDGGHRAADLLAKSCLREIAQRGLDHLALLGG